MMLEGLNGPFCCISSVLVWWCQLVVQFVFFRASRDSPDISLSSMNSFGLAPLSASLLTMMLKASLMLAACRFFKGCANIALLS